ncbi:RNA polymerase sigma factor (sigma-70 family) [Arthrobacter sp. V1I9]|nr:RNA polymerase sigma factor (sigma-70 family) [Arthrobacter sp. V1I9]
MQGKGVPGTGIQPSLHLTPSLTESATSVTDALTDGTLREQAAGASAFSVVYRTYASQVLGYLTARGVEDPEAAMQEVFLSVLPRLDTVHGGAAGLRTFIFSVAHARIVDDHRRQSRTPAKLPFEPALDHREDSSAEAEALQRISPREVLNLLDGLPQDQREVLALRLVAGHTVEQTAAAMGRTPGAVKQLQRRALGKLRELSAVKEYLRP